MTEDQLRLALAQAVQRHARTLQDHGGKAGPVLLDDLVAVAHKYATEHAGKVAARQELRQQAAIDVTPLVAASPDPPSSHRTRTRTRRNPDDHS